MRKRRRIPMLTPLLDLLLIIVFAQLLSANRATSAAQEARNEAGTARQHARNEIERLDVIIEENTYSMDSLRSRIDSLEAANIVLEEQLGMQQEANVQYQAQIEAIGDLLQVQFNVPDEIISDVVTATSHEELEEVISYMEKVQEATPAEAVRLARQMTEVLRRVDFWDVYVDSTNAIYFSAGEDEIIDGFIPASEEATRSRLHEAMSGMPDPARLVIVLFSLHERSDREVWTWVENSLRSIAPAVGSSLNSSVIVTDRIFMSERP